MPDSERDASSHAVSLEEIMLSLISATQDLFPDFVGVELLAGHMDKQMPTVGMDPIAIIGTRVPPRTPRRKRRPRRPGRGGGLATPARRSPRAASARPAGLAEREAAGWPDGFFDTAPGLLRRPAVERTHPGVGVR
jgi:hypothetical protein